MTFYRRGVLLRRLVTSTLRVLVLYFTFIPLHCNRTGIIMFYRWLGVTFLVSK